MDIIEGKTYQSSNYGEFVVIKIFNSKSVDIEFIKTGYRTSVRFDTIRNGGVKDRLSPSVHGVGFVGDGKYATSVNGKNNDAYLSWQRMIGRCYDENYIHSYLYKDVSVCKEWHNFQNFAEWFYANYPKDGKKYHLDKDIKIKGNRIYSPDTCMFVTAEENIAAAKEKEFSAVSPDGVLFRFTNMAKFCRDHNLNKANFHKVVTGKYKSCKGWTAYVE